MQNSIGFDNDKYLNEQTEEILKRVKRFNNKLYLEFGGKLLFDYHAARVLPGFDTNVKMRLLQKLKDNIDVILCIYAGDIERKKIRADFGITYDVDALKTIDDFKEWGIEINSVVITRFENQTSAIAFKNKLDRRGVKVYTHKITKGYPTDIDLIVSDEGYGDNEYIETTKPIVVVTGPGPGSGKLATCLSQLYHEYKRGIKAGFAKFETFPIWNLPLKHKVNVAYEAAHIPIVWATQVLETMAKKGRPSRAEITDAASAEQTECVMLNKGPHIFEVIKMLDEILSSMQDYHEKKAPMLPPL